MKQKVEDFKYDITKFVKNWVCFNSGVSFKKKLKSCSLNILVNN